MKTIARTLATGIMVMISLLHSIASAADPSSDSAMLKSMEQIEELRSEYVDNNTVEERKKAIKAELEKERNTVLEAKNELNELASELKNLTIDRDKKYDLMSIRLKDGVNYLATASLLVGFYHFSTPKFTPVPFHNVTWYLESFADKMRKDYGLVLPKETAGRIANNAGILMIIGLSGATAYTSAQTVMQFAMAGYDKAQLLITEEEMKRLSANIASLSALSSAHEKFLELTLNEMN